MLKLQKIVLLFLKILLIYPNFLDMIRLFAILAITLLSNSMAAQTPDSCAYIKGKTAITSILTPTCYGDCDGTITMGTWVGTGPVFINFYLDDLTQKQTIPIFLGVVCGGSHKLITENGNDGCKDTIVFFMPQPDSIKLSVKIDSITCSKGAFTASASGGTGTLEFTWNTLPNTTFDPKVSNISAGQTLRVTAKDSRQCQNALDVTMPFAITKTHLNKTICEGYPYNFNGSFLTKSGVYQATHKALDGCDSTVNLDLVVLPSDTIRLQKTLCTGSSGVFSEVLKKVNGCDSVIITTVKIATNINALITEQNKVLTLSSSLTGVTYQWFLNGKAIVGANSAAFTAFVDGLYFIEITDSNGCKFNSNAIQIGMIAAKDIPNNANIQLFPNPLQNDLMITADFPIQKVEITNALGQILLSQKTDNQKVTLNTSTFVKGVYFTKVFIEKNNYQVFKVLKQE